MSPNAFLLRMLGLMVILLGLVACGEWWVRGCLFSDAPCAQWRDPNIYTWRYSVGERVVQQDDQAKLSVLWRDSAASHLEGAHPLLGWAGGLDSATLLPSGFRAGSGKAPFVLLGAGWAELGAGRRVAEDPVIRAGLDLVDLSVPGFSMDQDLLLLERTLPNFRGGQVLLWIDVDRLDHLQRTFVGRPKPWYTPTPSGGKLQGVPVETDIRRFLEDHPADPGLYSYHLFRTLVLKDTVLSIQAIQARESSLQELTKRLFFMLVKKAEEAGVTLRLILDQRATGAHADDRRWALEQVCKDHHVEFDILPRQTDGSDTRFHGDACTLLARKASYEFEFTMDPEMVAVRASGAEELQTTNPLRQVMVRILGDSSWLGSIKEKALLNRVPIREMMRRDAQYSLDPYGK